MQLCLFRHAARNPLQPGDGGLSDHGLKQAAALPDLASTSGPLPRPTHLLCSPKRRARQTFAPLSGRFDIPLRIDVALDERGENEPMDAFLERLSAWVESLKTAFAPDDVVFACSHLDVWEEVMSLIPTDLAEWEIARGLAPAEFRLFEFDGGFFTAKATGKA